MLKTIKRDCSLDDFKEEKISNAILMAMKNAWTGLDCQTA